MRIRAKVVWLVMICSIAILGTGLATARLVSSQNQQPAVEIKGYVFENGVPQKGIFVVATAPPGKKSITISQTNKETDGDGFFSLKVQGEIDAAINIRFTENKKRVGELNMIAVRGQTIYKAIDRNRSEVAELYRDYLAVTCNADLKRLGYIDNTNKDDHGAPIVISFENDTRFLQSSLIERIKKGLPAELPSEFKSELEQFAKKHDKKENPN